MTEKFNPLLKSDEQSHPLEIEKEEGWLEHPEEGELAVDVYEQGEDVVIRSTIAGIKPENIDVFIENDMVTVRGKRIEDEDVRQRNYFFKECYWGNFSRTIILPVHIKGDEAQAVLKNGVLKITIPKAKKAAKIIIEEIPEEV